WMVRTAQQCSVLTGPSLRVGWSGSAGSSPLGSRVISDDGLDGTMRISLQSVTPALAFMPNTMYFTTWLHPASTSAKRESVICLCSALAVNGNVYRCALYVYTT